MRPTSVVRTHVTYPTPVTLDFPTELSIVEASAAAQNVPLSYVVFDSAVQTGPSSILATTTTNYPLTAGMDPTTLYLQLVAALNSSISSGGFTSVLQQASIVNGATTTASAVVLSLSTTAPVVVTPSSSGGSNKLSDGIIAAIVICSVVGKFT